MHAFSLAAAVLPLGAVAANVAADAGGSQAPPTYVDTTYSAPTVATVVTYSGTSSVAPLYPTSSSSPAGDSSYPVSSYSVAPSPSYPGSPMTPVPIVSNGTMSSAYSTLSPSTSSGAAAGNLSTTAGSLSTSVVVATVTGSNGQPSTETSIALVTPSGGVPPSPSSTGSTQTGAAAAFRVQAGVAVAGIVALAMGLL